RPDSGVQGASERTRRHLHRQDGGEPDDAGRATMTDKLPAKAGPSKSGLIPWPPLIYCAAIAISIVLGLFYPLPWIGDLLGDLLFAAGFVVLFAVAALWFTAIRAMVRARTTMNPN